MSKQLYPVTKSDNVYSSVEDGSALKELLAKTGNISQKEINEYFAGHFVTTDELIKDEKSIAAAIADLNRLVQLLKNESSDDSSDDELDWEEYE